MPSPIRPVDVDPGRRRPGRRWFGRRWFRRRRLPAWVRRIDRSAARRINRRRTHPTVDRGFRRLSQAADHGRLWLAIAAVLAVSGRPRAGLRGIASLSVASFVANLIGKKVFGGDRPLLKDVPVVRHLKQQPTSKSFPSGHSASAAAFAAGVAIESPRAGALVAPVAAGVAYSRLHTGAHWLSDVVGGSALGVGAALVGRAVAPPRRRQPAATVPRGERIRLPAAPDGAGLFLIVNAASGRGVEGVDPLTIVERRLPRARVHVREPGEPLEDVVRGAIDDGVPSALGVLGGDGTVEAVAHAARRHDLPLVVLPGGTFNHFARAVGVGSVDDGIDAVLGGEGVLVDVAEATVDGADAVTVVNAASVGIYPDFVAERERLEPRVGKRLAGAIAAVRVLARAHPVSISTGGRRATVWSLFVGVNRNSPAIIAPMQRHDLDDGTLDVRLLHATTRVRAFASLAFGRRSARVLAALGLRPGRSAVEAFESEELVVTVRPRAGESPGFAHDGEVELEPGREEGAAPATPAPYEAHIRIIPRGLRVYTPPAPPAAERKDGT